MTALPRGVVRLRSDAHLLARFRAGDDSAFSALHQRHGPTIRSYAAFMLRGTSHDPDDAAQDVFLRAYEALRRDERPVEVRPWLFRVAHNRCIDALRRPVAAELHDHHHPAMAGPHAGHEHREALRALLRDIGRLPERQRSALLLRELGGLSHEAVADALGVTVSASKMLVVRARVTLTEAADARSATCGEVRDRLAAAADAGRRPGRADERHVRECPACAACQRARASLERELALLPGGGLGLLGLLGVVTGGGGAKVAATVCCALAGAGAITTTALRMERPARPAAGHGVPAAKRVKPATSLAAAAVAIDPATGRLLPTPADDGRADAAPAEPQAADDLSEPGAEAPATPEGEDAPAAQRAQAQPHERIDLAQFDDDAAATRPDTPTTTTDADLSAQPEPEPQADAEPEPAEAAPETAGERIDLATLEEDGTAG